MAEQDTAPGPALACMGGAPAPAEIVTDWQRFEALDDAALAQLWDILEPSLSSAPGPALEKRAEGFCSLYGIAPADLRASLRVCRFLLGRAAALGESREAFAADLGQLAGRAASAAAEVLLSRYDRAVAQLRRNITEQTLLDHGQVLTGLDWRVDIIAGSDRGHALDTPTALITLRLQHHEQTERVSFYAVPQALAQIRQTLDQIEKTTAAAQARLGGTRNSNG